MLQEILTEVERGRRWSDEQKLAIVNEVGVGGASVADVARRHDVGRQQIYAWRRQLRRKGLNRPELNSVENVWQLLRETWLSNRVFRSYRDILDHCARAWKRLTDQPWLIMSIGLRQWAMSSAH